MNPVKVISLRRAQARRAEFARTNAQLKFAFADAVDGAAMTLEDVRRTHAFEEGLPYTAGAYGCALSHLMLWDEAVEREQPVTVAEDDAIFRLDFVRQRRKLLAGLPADWDIVLWGWNFDSALALNVMPGVSPAVVMADQETLRSTTETFRQSTGTPHLFGLDRCFGIPAYTISAGGARKFMSLCFPMQPFELVFPLLGQPVPNSGIDVAMNRAYGRTNSFVCFPPLVVTKNDHAISTIQNGSSLAEVETLQG